MKTLVPAAVLITALASPSAFAKPVATVSPSAVLSKARTIQVTETIFGARPGSPTLAPVAVMTVNVERPNKIHLEQKASASAPKPAMMMVSDGTSAYEFVASRNQYRKTDSATGLADRLLGFQAFSGVVPTNTVLAGKPMILFTVSRSGGQSLTQKLWVDAKTHLPARQSISLTQNGKAQEVQRTVFSGWILNQPIDAALFAWTAPAGSKEYVETPQPKLLAAGTQAPDFTVNDRDGKPVKLSDYRGKVVVLDFWATWCPPCQASLPHTNEVAKQFKDKGVVVLAVNTSDTKVAFDKWLPQHKLLDSLIFAIDPATEPGKDIAGSLYNVTGIPTQYVIDKEGKIVKSFVGFSGPTEDLANTLKAAGAS